MWYDKIIKWIPEHFTGVNYNVYFRSTASLLDELQKVLQEHLQETFIAQANKPYQPPINRRGSYQDLTFLDIHAQERGLERLSYTAKAEADANFQNRIRNIKFNRTNQNIINNLLPVTGNVSVKVEPDFDANFLDASGASDKRAETVYSGTIGQKTVTIGGASYGNYGPLDYLKRKNCFSVLLDVTIREPHSFFNDDEFYNALAFYDERSRTFLAGQFPVLQALIKQKAPAGSGWRILAKGFDGTVDSAQTLAKQQEGIN